MKNIIKKEKVGNIMVYHIDKIISDEKMDKLKGKKITPAMIHTIIDIDSDVYTADGKLLLKFRKDKLSMKNINLFYENVIDFAKHTSSNRSAASGSKKYNISTNPKIMTNILGYFDIWGPSQKRAFKDRNIKLPLEVRETKFTSEFPEKHKNIIPLIQNIDTLYKKYAPSYYEKQRKKANQTAFKIPNTAFTTITTNINFQTAIHKDVGDDIEGFGNLAVIEHGGEYSGAETCFPQYGIGINVRTGDILFMDVHEWHANLPMIVTDSPSSEKTIRLSIVCYLRHNVWNRSKGKTKKYMIQHNKTIKKILND